MCFRQANRLFLLTEMKGKIKHETKHVDDIVDKWKKRNKEVSNNDQS